MAIRYTDDEIFALIKEPKAVPGGFFSNLNLVDRDAYRRYDGAVVGDEGTRFSMKLREGRTNKVDFSAILAVEVPHSNVLFILRRYNGRSHRHKNKIEGDRFYGFHVHTATQRYQERGFDEEGYAEPTGRYSTFSGALRCLYKDCGFYKPGAQQRSLFDLLQDT